MCSSPARWEPTRRSGTARSPRRVPPPYLHLVRLGGEPHRGVRRPGVHCRVGGIDGWALDKTGTINGASSTSAPFPSLTPAVSGELYFGYSVPGNVATGGTTSGFTYDVTAEGNLVAFDTNVTGAVAPVGTQSPASTSSAIGVLLSATNGAPPPAPTVTGSAPTSGSTAGGTSVTITGTDFTGVTAVNFGRATAAAQLHRQHATSITVPRPGRRRAPSTSPSAPAGGTSATSAGRPVHLLRPPPDRHRLTPDLGVAAGGTSVTITGTGFTGATGGRPSAAPAATLFTVNSATHDHRHAPAAGAGTVDVTVTAAGGTATTAGDQFTYVAPPRPSPPLPRPPARRRVARRHDHRHQLHRGHRGNFGAPAAAPSPSTPRRRSPPHVAGRSRAPST